MPVRRGCPLTQTRQRWTRTPWRWTLSWVRRRWTRRQSWLPLGSPPSAPPRWGTRGLVCRGLVVEWIAKNAKITTLASDSPHAFIDWVQCTHSSPLVAPFWGNPHAGKKGGGQREDGSQGRCSRGQEAPVPPVHEPPRRLWWGRRWQLPRWALTPGDFVRVVLLQAIVRRVCTIHV